MSPSTVRPPRLEEIRRAARRTEGVVVRSPLVPFHDFPPRSDLLLKLEIHQPVGSFKIRGIFNAVARLTDEQRAAGLSTVSAGNTAQALAWTGSHFGVPARSLMPESAPRTKIDAVLRYGGEPVLVPTAELFRYLEQRLWESEPYAFIHPWTNRDVMIGHGTLGPEILADCPDVETVYVPVGGGGLIGGVASALKALDPEIRVVGVEPDGCAALYASLAQGRAARVDCQTMCDGVAVPYMTDEVFSVLRDRVDTVVRITEAEIRATIRKLLRGNRIVAEGSAALSVAAALKDPAGGRKVCLVTGGCIDESTLVEVLSERTDERP